MGRWENGYNSASEEFARRLGDTLPGRVPTLTVSEIVDAGLDKMWERCLYACVYKEDRDRIRALPLHEPGGERRDTIPPTTRENPDDH